MASPPLSDLLRHVIPQKEVTRKRRTSCCKSSPIDSILQWTKESKEKIGDKERKPEWLDSFLRRTFFDPCQEHPIRRNERNKYCVDCDASACQYCISSGAHRQHIILKIYRHVYKDVVPLHSMAKHIDCSEIQPYKSNKILIVALNPLPHCGLLSINGETCEICKRRLTNAGLYKYCSISCKVTAFSRKHSDSEPPYLSIRAPEIKELPQKMHCKRKGTPHRAHFF